MVDLSLDPTSALFAVSGALAIGLSLGLLGGGGSILTVPVFVYALGVPASSAVAMSMPVVGLTSLVGVIRHWRAGHVQWRTALSFGAFAMGAAYGGAWIGRRIGGETQLLLLAALMGVTAVRMWRRAPEPARGGDTPPHRHPLLLAAIAVGVGMLTGIVGIGGGFLVVPALVMFGGLRMTHAIGTSLAVIVLNSAAGLAGYAGHVPIEWGTVTWFTACAAVGILIGAHFASRVPAATLRRAFALLLLVIGALLLWQRLGALLH